MTLPARGSREDLHLRESLGLSDKPDDALFVAKWLGKLILFGIGQAGATRCPGLSTDDCNFLQLYDKKETWTPNAVGGLSLVETKVVSAKFLASGAFHDTERFLPALFASADPNSRLSDIGDDILKRANSVVSFEDPALVQQLYEIYLGTRGAQGSLPARVPLQTKILTLLCKSKLASSFVPQSIQIVREGLSAPKSAQHNTIVSAPKQGLEISKLRYVFRIPSCWEFDLFARFIFQLENGHPPLPSPHPSSPPNRILISHNDKAVLARSSRCSILCHNKDTIFCLARLVSRYAYLSLNCSFSYLTHWTWLTS